MPIPLLVIFACGVGVPPAQNLFNLPSLVFKLGARVSIPDRDFSRFQPSGPLARLGIGSVSIPERDFSRFQLGEDAIALRSTAFQSLKGILVDFNLGCFPGVLPWELACFNA